MSSRSSLKGSQVGEGSGCAEGHNPLCTNIVYQAASLIYNVKYSLICSLWIKKNCRWIKKIVDKACFDVYRIRTKQEKIKIYKQFLTVLSFRNCTWPLRPSS